MLSSHSRAYLVAKQKMHDNLLGPRLPPRQKLALFLLLVLVLLILPSAILVGYLGLTSMEGFWAFKVSSLYSRPVW